METISVIVPVYNAERYLEECVSSILAQTYSEIEVVLVDDGSTDRSPEICDIFGANDARVKVIHQENRGLSGARNRGIEECTGSFLTFVDADDLIDAHFLEILHRLLTEQKCEIAIGSFQLYYGGERNTLAEGSEQRYSRRDSLQMLNGWRDRKVTSFITAWGKLYRRELWNGIRFPLGVWHEDEFAAHHILNRVTAVIWTERELYYYRQHDSAFSSRGMQNPAHDTLFRALEERCVCYQEWEPDLVDGAVHHLLRECNSFYDEYSRLNGPTSQEKRRWLVQVYRKSYFRFFRYISMQERAKGAVFAFFPRLYHFISLQKWNRQE